MSPEQSLFGVKVCPIVIAAPAGEALPATRPTKATTDAPKSAKAMLGRFAYFLNALAQLPNIGSYDMTFRAEGWEEKVKCFGFAVGNGAAAGGGLRLAPEAKLNDGRLDVLIAPDQSFINLSQIAAELLKAEPDLKPHNVIYRKVEALTVTCESEIQANADGEALKSTTFEFGIMPDAIAMAVAKLDAV